MEGAARRGIDLLLVLDDPEEANRLASLLGNHGFEVLPRQAADAEELARQVRARNWDLLIARYGGVVPPAGVLHHVRRANKDIPVLFLLEAPDPDQRADALRLGAEDAVPADAEKLLVQVVRRALANLEQRRRLRYWQRRFAESESRLEQLLMSSRAPIALVQDGTYVLVNEPYARLFGHHHPEEMTLTPVIDTIAPASQGRLRPWLKPLDPENAFDQETLSFTALSSQGEELPVHATLAQVDYRGEPALQITLREPPSARREAEGPADVSEVRTRELVEELNALIRRAARSGEDALLLYLAVDRFEALQGELGLEATEAGVAELARYLDAHLGERLLFGRLGEETFVAALPGNDAEGAVALAERLRQGVASQIFPAGQASFTCTLSIAITPLGETTATADEALASCRKLAAELARGGGNAVRFHEPVVELREGQLDDEELVRIGRLLLKKDLVQVHFQPLVALRGEARPWYEVQMALPAEAFAEGEIPQDFVARIFRTPVGRELDQKVLERAAASLAARKEEVPDLRLAVHLCHASVADPTLPEQLARTLERFSLKPADFVFQLREYEIAHHLGSAAHLLAELQKLGAERALTHFGLAVQPTATLGRIAVDYVKVAGSLVDKAQRDKEALEELKALIAEVKRLGLRVVVPHIESATVIPALWQVGADYLQGYYFQPPAPEMAFDFSEE